MDFHFFDVLAWSPEFKKILELRDVGMHSKNYSYRPRIMVGPRPRGNCARDMSGEELWTRFLFSPPETVLQHPSSRIFIFLNSEFKNFQEGHAHAPDGPTAPPMAPRCDQATPRQGGTD